MKKIALGLRKMVALVKVAFGRKTVVAMTGNMSFPTPDPPLNKITDVCDRLETAKNEADLAWQIAKEKTTIQNQVEDEYDDLINKLANYVEVTSNGDIAKIESANMNPKSDAVRSGELPEIPVNLTITLSDLENEMDLMWEPVDGAKSYNIYMSTNADDPTKWTFVKSSTRSSAFVTGLSSMQRYYFRVAALNANGQGGFSETASKVRY
jgi:hypothetical protein